MKEIIRHMSHKMEKGSRIEIPEEEVELIFSRSSGSGGQNVNKVSSKVTLRWNVEKSKTLDTVQKKLIWRRLANKIDQEGNIVLYSQTRRSQQQNRKEVMEKLNNLIDTALQPRKKRYPTRPPRSAQERRLQEKKIVSQKKKNRRPPTEW